MGGYEGGRWDVGVEGGAVYVERISEDDKSLFEDSLEPEEARQLAGLLTKYADKAEQAGESDEDDEDSDDEDSDGEKSKSAKSDGESDDDDSDDDSDDEDSDDEDSDDDKAKDSDDEDSDDDKSKDSKD
ncbi:hypothetical protein K875_02732 [Mycobacterium rhizamassiliense]|jgi:hypothetical protein|uniref:Uncharacterized protein n=1 Tax=Mycobacterium rhizamassiliense TaxID=1841860 RepID=A0A2U3NM02_9MYCO|nr:hypothetical protein [Mycobacterium rhizamassiliense]SPM32464.1 hypothetical protein K875_02732 [Mycobacterium rhizamassiliense]